eukprot:3357086-Prymnesium_polylepis.1
MQPCIITIAAKPSCTAPLSESRCSFHRTHPVHQHSCARGVGDRATFQQHPAVHTYQGSTRGCASIVCRGFVRVGDNAAGHRQHARVDVNCASLCPLRVDKSTARHADLAAFTNEHRPTRKARHAWST